MTTDSTAPDPFENLDALRVTAWDDVETEEVITSIKVRRPKRTEFFRIRPEPEFTVDLAIFVHEGGDGFEKTPYMVLPHLVNELSGDVVPARVFVAQNPHGETFLFPARLPTTDGGGRDWHRSALGAIDLAKNEWVRIDGRRKELGRYRVFKPRANERPGEPKWPDLDMREMMRMGWADQLIDSLDHPVILELGEAV